MDSFDGDSDSECNRKSMFIAVTVEQRKGEELSERERCSEVQRYLEEGVDINAVDEKGNTVLHIAVRRGFEGVVKFLLEKDARRDIENNQGDTAITLADSLAKLEIVRIFKDFDGKPDPQSAGTSNIQKFDDRANNCQSVSSCSNRKRSARTKFVNNSKEQKLTTTNKLVGSVEKHNLDTKARLANIALRTDKRIVGRRLVDSGESPGTPIAGTSGTQRIDNPHEDSRAFPERSSRKRPTGNKLIRSSVKVLKIDTTDRVQRASRFGSTATTLEQENRGDEDDIEDITDSDLDNKTTYPASGAKNSLHGVIYQLKHLMLVLNRAHRLGYAFRLATEMDSAEKFDDLVFEYKDREGRRAHRFVQMKHKQDDTKLIRVSDLLADDDSEFSMRKYFISWRRVKKHPDFAKSKSKSFILCTNIGIDVEDLENEQIDVTPVAETEADDFLSVTNREEQPPRYKLLPSRNSKLYAQLESASDVHILAKAMANCIDDTKKMHLKTDIFKRYHAALGLEILVDVGGKKRKFSDAFIKNSGLSPKAENFREIFVTYMKQILPEADIWETLKKTILTTSGNFGKSATSGSQPIQLIELPDENIVAGEITEFFEQFILAVDQPNEEDLSEMIKHELGETSQFNLLNTDLIGDSFQNQMLNWFKAKHGDFLIHEDAKKFFDRIESELNSLIAVGINLAYPTKLKDYNVKFNREIEDLDTFLNSSTPTESPVLLLLFSRITLLTALKVFQTIQRIEKWQKSDSFIFMELGNLVLPDIGDRVFRAFQSSRSHNLLVVDCGLDSSKRDKVKLYKQTCEMMEKLKKQRISNKKIIVIIPQTDDRAIRSKVGYPTADEACVDTSLDDVERSSLLKLLEKSLVKFQGRNKKMSFVQLLGAEMLEDAVEENLKEYGQIIGPNTLAKLILGDEIRMGGPCQGLGEVSDYYIPRTIDLVEIVLHRNIFRIPSPPDMFAISGIVEGNLAKILTKRNKKTISETLQSSHREKYIILKHQQEIEHFDTLCRQNPNKNIHWLQAKSKKFIWVKSFGTVSNLLKYKVENGNDVQYAIQLTDDQLAEHDEQRKIVIISDTAGMGKSTVLTHLEQKIMENEPSLLVIKVNLTEHTDALDAEQKNPTFDSTDTDGAINFLVDKLVPDLESASALLLKTMIKARRKAALLFDGFDEISPSYARTAIDMLQALAKLEVKRLFVTTRPHTSRALEKALGVFSHTLQPFSEENQVDFLTKFWKRGLRTGGQPETEGSLRSYAQAVIELLTLSIDQSKKEITGVPLQTRLVAESFSSNQSELPETINIIELYRSFVDKKYQIFMTEKSRVDPTNLSVQSFSEHEKQRFLKMHQKFALELLFDDATVAKLLRTQQIGNEDRDTSHDISVNDQRTGIVTLNSEGKLQFIHRTFAEYFAAEVLVETLINDSEDSEVQKFFIKQFFVLPEYETTRSFTNRLLASENKLPKKEFWYSDSIETYYEVEPAFYNAVREQNLEILKFFVNVLKRCTTKRLVTASDRELLHLAGTKGDLDFMTLIIKKGGDIEFAGVREGTPLCIASFEGRLDVVKDLLSMGANTDARVENGQTPLIVAISRNNLPIIKFLIQNGANIEARNKNAQTPLIVAISCGSLSIVKLLLQKGADTAAKDAFDMTPLRLAVCEGKLTLVTQLLKKGANIEARDLFGYTPLHLAVKTGYLDMVKHLIHWGAKINSKTKDGLTPLRLAERLCHSDVIDYLIQEVIRWTENVGRPAFHYR